MKYKLSITRRKPNPDYKPPRGTSGIYNQPYDIPKDSVYDVLDVEISEEQFIAIRKAVIEKF